MGPSSITPSPPSTITEGAQGQHALQHRHDIQEERPSLYLRMEGAEVLGLLPSLVGQRKLDKTLPSYIWKANPSCQLYMLMLSSRTIIGG